MKTSYRHYVCGFNGFGQVVQLLSFDETLEKGSSTVLVPGKSDEEVDQSPDNDYTDEQHVLSFSVPQKIENEVKLCTWSNIWSVTDSGSIHCSGNCCLPTNVSKLQNEGEPLSVSLVPTGNNVLLQDGSKTVLVKDTGMICQLMINVEDVSLIDSTKDCIYGLKDGRGYEGQVLDASESQDDMMLTLHSFTLTLEVQTVSCGLEHTLILTQQGRVYSYGSGSRGQLGHGEVTIDPVKVVRLVSTFTGISVVTIAAGGWHSVAVTDTGDVYVWGWNESGQLGLPNGTDSKHIDSKTNKDYTSVQTMDISAVEGNTKNQTVYESDISSRKTPDESRSWKRKYSDAEEENCEETTESASDQIDVMKQFNVNKEECDFSNRKSRKDIPYNKESESDIAPNLDTVSDIPNPFRVEGVGSRCKKETFYQDLDCLQVQTLPYGLALPDEMHVKLASCGTRHTCILTGSGILLTAGWNNYGQLCHGDTQSRDYFETVAFFANKNEKVVNVKAQYWNTVVSTETHTYTD